MTSRTVLAALGRVVVDDIQDYLETTIVEARNRFLEFAQTVRHLGRVSEISGEECN
jgi:hypothetical protein